MDSYYQKYLKYKKKYLDLVNLQEQIGGADKKIKDCPWGDSCRFKDKNCWRGAHTTQSSNPPPSGAGVASSGAAKVVSSGTT